MNTDQETGLKKYVVFMILWSVPSQTPLYILLHDAWGWDILNAFIISGLVSGTVFYFFWSKLNEIIERRLHKIIK